jgi:hypothetical protein
MSEAIEVSGSAGALVAPSSYPHIKDELEHLAVPENFEKLRGQYLEAADSRRKDAFLSKDPSDQVLILADELRKARVFQERISPPGAFHLPPLLDQRRIAYGIVDRCFTDHHAVNDIVLVWQIEQFEGTKYGDTMIEAPEQAKARERLECGRGIIVSAGLKALDELYSHGMSVGHIVNVGKHAPRRIRVDVVSGNPQYLLKIHPGDIADSEDLAKMLSSGSIVVQRALASDGTPVHGYRWRDPVTKELGPMVMPLAPWQSDDQ